MAESIKHLVVTLGLTKEQISFVNAVLPADCIVSIADAIKDVRTFQDVVSIIYKPVVDEADLKRLFDYYEEIFYCTSDVVILLGYNKVSQQMKSVFKCYASFDDLKPELKYILLKAHRRERKVSEYSRQLVNGLRILGKISSCPGITTKALAEYNGCSVRSVQRYIESLRVAGEFVEYDRKKRGGHLPFGRPMLFGDVWDDMWNPEEN